MTPHRAALMYYLLPSSLLSTADFYRNDLGVGTSYCPEFMLRTQLGSLVLSI